MICSAAHERLVHAQCIWKKKTKIDEEWYGVPEPAVQMFLTLCPECAPTQQITRKSKMSPLKMILSETIGSRAQLDLIDMTSQEHNGYSWVLQYHDHHSGLHMLWHCEIKLAGMNQQSSCVKGNMFPYLI